MPFVYFTHTLETLKKMPSQHPKNPISDGDIAWVFNPSNHDGQLIYKAVVMTSPIDNTHLSIASNDGRIQWDLFSQYFGNGGIPRSTEVKCLPISGGVPDGWAVSSVNDNFFYTSMAGKLEYSWGECWMWEMNSIIYLFHGGGIQTFDISTPLNVSNFYTFPILPGETSIYDIYRHSPTLCKVDGKIHVIGGTTSPQVHHHTFDTAAGAWEINGKANAPEAVRDATLIDTSEIDNCLWLFTTGLNVYQYDITTNIWGAKNNKPLNLKIYTAIEDYEIENAFIILFSNYHLYRFRPLTDTWEFLIDMSGGVFWADNNSFIAYDYHSSRYFFIMGADLVWYDTMTDIKESVVGIYPFTEDFYGYSGVVSLGNGYYAVCNSEEYYTIHLVSATPDITLKRL